MYGCLDWRILQEAVPNRGKKLLYGRRSVFRRRATAKAEQSVGLFALPRGGADRVLSLDGILLLPGAVPALFQRIPVPESSKSISLRFGNLLRCRNGTILVGINNTLTYDEDKIGRDSIHNQLIQKYGIDWMRQVFEAEKEKAGLTVYPPGYAFSARAEDGREYLFVVMSELKAAGVPKTAPGEVRKVAQVLFSSDEFRCRNKRLYSPILGTGSAALLCAQRDVAEQIAFEFVCAAAQNSAAVHELVLVFRWRNLPRIQLTALKQSIAQIAERCRSCPRKTKCNSSAPKPSPRGEGVAAGDG